jgi:hypothetical protein
MIGVGMNYDMKEIWNYVKEEGMKGGKVGIYDKKGRHETMKRREGMKLW